LLFHSGQGVGERGEERLALAPCAGLESPAPSVERLLYLPFGVGSRGEMLRISVLGAGWMGAGLGALLVCWLLLVAAQQQERGEHGDCRQFGSVGLLAGHANARGRGRKTGKKQQQAGAAAQGGRLARRYPRPLQKHGWLPFLSG
jgi:hypothetical protein